MKLFFHSMLFRCLKIFNIKLQLKFGNKKNVFDTKEIFNSNLKLYLLALNSSWLIQVFYSYRV